MPRSKSPSPSPGSPADLVSRLRAGERVSLGRHDPGATFGWDKDEAKEALADELEQLAELQTRLFAEGKHSMLVVLQALDAGGKDGTLRKVFTGLDPAGVRVASFSVPTEEELAHDYLWRIHLRLPRRGQIGVFNRSHYEDVLVVRVRSLAPKAVWSRRYEHIREFEQMLVDEGTSVVKFFLNISKDEQRERLQERVDRPEKHWKFRMGDLEDRALWDDYQQAYRDAIGRTSTPDAPWYVVPANRKWVRNLVIARILRHHLERLDPQYPEPEQHIDGIVVP